jgi:seryl-tRNA synthetase
MIDLAQLREQPAEFKALILRKEPSFPVDQLITLEQHVRSIRHDVEQLRKDKNDLASQGAKGITPEVRERSITIGKELKAKEAALAEQEEAFKKLWLTCPNVPQEDLPLGNKEANKPVKVVGEKRVFDFPHKNHVELNEKLGWFDMETAASMSGSGFVLYRGIGAKIMYALTRLMLKNNASFGFEPVIPPYLINRQGMYNASNLPKFEGDFYEIAGEDLCLIPTAEVNLTNIYANRIFDAGQLPSRMTAWTSCFRREAGTYGSTERGLIRIHQFEKVELYSIVEPEKANDELDFMVGCAENILTQLGLHYRVSLLATQDCSFASSKTFDIEVWLPGQDRYYEVSSCSNCTDFQARRAQIRYRKSAEAKPSLANTLNASSLALPRLMVALMENYQQADGSVTLPKVLTDLMNDLW